MTLLDGKVALVTGGGRGIGRAISLQLAQEGACVVVNDPGCGLDGTGEDPSVADAVVKEIVERGGRAIASHHDVAKADGARAAVQQAIDGFEALHILVCCAGIARDRTLLKMEEDSWTNVLHTMASGTFFCIQAASKQMIAQGSGGRIVAMTGLHGYVGSFGQANMAAACGAVHGLCRTAAIELQKHRISVNAVAPLATTRMTEETAMLQGFDNLTPEHVVPVALMLASDRCGERTGYVLAVAGARVHSYRFVESPGKFKDEAAGVFTPEEVDENWQAITR